MTARVERKLFEISINHVLSELYGQSWYEDPVLHPNALERLQIQKALDGLARERKPITNGHLVAAANFGLWVNLFNSPYEELWRKCLRRVFVASTVRLDTLPHYINGCFSRLS